MTVYVDDMHLSEMGRFGRMQRRRDPNGTLLPPAEAMAWIRARTPPPRAPDEGAE